MPKKPKKNSFHPRIAISNKTLAIIAAAAAIIIMAGYGLYSVLSNPKQSWLKIQAQNLKVSLTGNKAGNEAAALGKVKSVVYIPILMYHHVGPLPEKPDALRRDMTVSGSNFELQVAWLKSQGYESIHLNDLLQYSKGKFKLPDKPVILTFDDGYSDVFDYAVPTLVKWGFDGSFGIITQFPGITQGTNQYASWQQIKQAQKDGMEIVSHTQDHFDGTNPRYDAAFILRNLADSQKDLQNNLGASVPILIYPYGHYNEQYIKMARQAGFEMGLTTKFGQKIETNNLMEISRVRIHGNEDLETFKRVILSGDGAGADNGE